MGCIVRVLFDVTDETLKNTKAMSVAERERAIYNQLESLKENITGYYYHQIDYFKSFCPDTSMDSGEFILGSERPDNLKQLVGDWNSDIFENLRREMTNLEEAAKNRGFERFSELVAAAKDESTLLKCGLLDLKYPASIYTTRKAMDAADDMFTYGGNVMVFVDGFGQGTLVSDSIRKEVEDHPERFAIAELAYD